MATGRDGEVYATLLLSDTYLPGALVLAHSLLDNGTTKKLAVLVTEDAVSREAIAQLENVYHHVIPVPRIRNAHPHNLELMNRVDLHSAFTKITLWNQTQFSKIVYIDADIVAYRAPDELFAIDASFSAAPDIGWPDIFNTGVMVLTPDAAEYERLRAKAEDGLSFDGADQGLLNMHFGANYNRISFTYNVTPSAHYQYIPAYKHFQSSINMVHFIGAQKPWFQGRPDGGSASTSNSNDAQEASPHETMTQTWWDVYDKHYGQDEQGDYPPASQEDAKLVQYLVRGEFNPFAATTQSQSGNHEQQYQTATHEHPQEPDHTSFHPTEELHPPPPSGGADPAPAPETHQSTFQKDRPTDGGGRPEPPPVERVERPPPPPMEPVWDASRQPPPTFSKPEAPDFPDTRYEMSRDSAPFVPPERYPSPPRGMWYDIPAERPEPSRKPKPIFPWESHQAPPTRVFAPDYVTPILKKPEVRLDPAIRRETSPLRAEGEPAEPSSPASSTRSVRFRDEDEEIDIPLAGSPLLDLDDEGTSPSDSVLSPPSPDPLEEVPAQASEFWNSLAAANAWDDVPGIRRYIERVIDQTGLGGRRRRDALRTKVIVDGKPMHVDEGPPPTRESRRGFFKITDFPSAIDRPSLPVTPALPTTPRDRWPDVRHEETEDEEDMPPPPQLGPLDVEAEGVPQQSEWVCVHGQLWGPCDCLCDLANVLRYHKNPVERLARLAADPEALLRRLEADTGEVPEREVVESSEGLPGGKKGGEGVQRDVRGGVRGVYSERRSGEPKDIGETRAQGGMGEARGTKGEKKGETPLVAPTPLKTRPADPVGSLEAASSLGGPGAGHKATYSEVAKAPTGVSETGDTDVKGAERTEREGAGKRGVKGAGQRGSMRPKEGSNRGVSELEASVLDI